MACKIHVTAYGEKTQTFALTRMGWKKALSVAKAHGHATIMLRCHDRPPVLPVVRCTRSGGCRAIAGSSSADRWAHTQLAGAGKKRKKRKKRKAARAKSKVKSYHKPKRLRAKRTAKGRKKR